MVLVLLVLSSGPAPATEPFQYITHPTGDDDSDFGTAVAVSGDTLVVTDSRNGELYLHTRAAGEWTHTETLTHPARPAAGVDIDGPVIAALAGRQTLVVFEHDGVDWDAGPEIALEERVRELAVDGGTIALTEAGRSGRVVIVEKGGGGWAVSEYVTLPEGTRTTGPIGMDDGVLAVLTNRGTVWTLEHDGNGFVPVQKIERSRFRIEDIAVGGRYMAIAGDHFDHDGQILVYRKRASGWARIAGPEQVQNRARNVAIDSAGRLAFSDEPRQHLWQLEGGRLVPVDEFRRTAGITRGAHDLALAFPQTIVSIRPHVLVHDAHSCEGLQATHVGTTGDDVIRGTTGDDVIVGLSGNDVLRGRGGRDILCGGTGGDVLVGGAGHDRLLGEWGDDRIVGNGGHDVLLGGAGDDIVKGGQGDDHLEGEEGDDSLFVGAGDDTALGGRGEDVLFGGPGDDTLSGGAHEDDTVSFDRSRSGVEVDLETGVATGDGTDTLSEFVIVIGSRHDDVIRGTAASDVLRGGRGDDTISPRDGRDDSKGGPGRDTLSFEDYHQSVYVALPSTTLKGNDRGSIHGFENVRGGPYGDNIWATAKSGHMEGMSGNDKIYIVNGRVTVDGGPGNDRVGFALRRKGVVARVTDYVSVESLGGTHFDDVLIGDDGPNTLVGVLGDDLLIGARGDDRLIGGPGADYLVPGPGDDEVYGSDRGDQRGERGDTVTFELSGSGISLDIVTGTARGEGNDSIEGIDVVVGSPHADDIHNARVTFGLQGNDTIVTRRTNEDSHTYPGRGNDKVTGRAPSGYFDFVYYEDNTTGVTVDLSRGRATGHGTDTLVGVDGAVGSQGDDRLIGGASREGFWGSTGQDTITANGGDDYLDGEEGTDSLNGGTGSDLCVRGESHTGCEIIRSRPRPLTDLQTLDRLGTPATWLAVTSQANGPATGSLGVTGRR
jgi:Ca2+-binding RTX toxin-like protein